MSAFNQDSGAKLLAALKRGIENITLNVLNENPRDYHKRGRVIRQDEWGWILSIDNATYTRIPSLERVADYKQGDVVEVMIPNGQPSNMFIMGRLGGVVSSGGDDSVTKEYLNNELLKYVTKTNLTLALANYVTTANLNDILSGYVTDAKLATQLANYVTTTALNNALAGYAKVATSGSYNDLTDKPTIPEKITSIDGLAGGTLTSPLNITGGDGQDKSKISLDQTNQGQITDKATSTIFGFLTSTDLTVGSTNYALRLRGSGSRPTFNGNDLALLSEVVTLTTTQTISGAKTFTAANNFTAETIFSNAQYAPTWADIASGVGKSSCFTRGAFMQAFIGQIIAPNSEDSQPITGGYEYEVDKIKFQRVISTSAGQPELEEMAVIAPNKMWVGGELVATNATVKGIFSLNTTTSTLTITTTNL